MHHLRKITLLAVVALAAMAVAASSASALSVALEPSGTTCTNTVTPTNHGTNGNGCGIKVNGTTVELGTALGMVTCNNAFEAKVGGNGVGYIYSQTLTSCSPVPVSVCAGDEAGSTAIWPASLASETTMNATFCVNVFGITVNCTLNGLTVSQNATHATTFSTGASHKACTAGGNSVQGTWTSVFDAAHPALEVVD